MATLSSDSGVGALSWREMHHLALATRDLEATVRFYTDVLGMQAGEIAPANPIHGRTCTIKPSANAVGELHFFEQPEAQPLQAHPEMLKQLIFPIVGVHHIAFMLPDAAGGLRRAKDPLNRIDFGRRPQRLPDAGGNPHVLHGSNYLDNLSI